MTLRALARSTKGPRKVAVPYVGRGASSLLPLRGGDVLLCALTLANAKMGSVTPSELRLLRRNGVKLFTREDLHAKVYLFGSRAVVCSANLSHNSGKLDEAGVLVTDREEVAAIREWFEMRLVEPVTSGWLARCAKAYRPPRFEGSNTERSIASKSVAGPWLVATVPDNTDRPAEEPLRSNVIEVASRRRVHPRKDDIETLRWTGRTHFTQEAKRGDNIVRLLREGQSSKYLPHGRILEKRGGRSATGKPITYFGIEMPKDYRTVPGTKLTAALHAEGLTLRRVRGRVVNRDLALALLRLTSPERLRR